MDPAPVEHVTLGPLTTLGVGGPARWFSEATSAEELARGLGWAKARGIPARILGGGSNVVVGDAGFEGLVLRLATLGRRFEGDGADVTLDVQAGEVWDDVVAESVARDCQGLECLSGIPGRVGATPIQNVGAYGQEVSETIEQVRVLDRSTLETRAMTPRECRFGYRDSFFKSEAPEGFVVLAVRFRLQRAGNPSVRYAELERALAALGPERPSLARTRDTVVALRRAKSMVLDPLDENGRSCGSFFVNPVVSAAQAADVQQRAGDATMPRYPQPDGRVKLAAGWLIEQSGFAKGFRAGPVGLSTRHALAIVCHGGARASDVLALKERIQAGVRARFGVSLVPEPVLWT